MTEIQNFQIDTTSKDGVRVRLYVVTLNGRIFQVTVEEARAEFIPEVLTFEVHS